MARELYGEANVHVRWMSEGGREVGKRPIETAYECERFDEVLTCLDAHYRYAKLDEFRSTK